MRPGQAKRKGHRAIRFNPREARGISASIPGRSALYTLTCSNILLLHKLYHFRFSTHQHFSDVHPFWIISHIELCLLV
jgi:hypothetical protein